MNLLRSDLLEDDHQGATAWTLPSEGDLGSTFRRGCFRGGAGKQQLAELEASAAKTIGQESEVPDAHKALGQYMQEEAPQELGSGECHLTLLAAVRVIFPAER